MKQILFALIPARGGSKGIKNKNIIDLNGKPLISYTIDQALSSKYIDEVYISSDSNQIKEISQKHGGLVPSLRPKDLAEDDSEMIDLLEYEVVQHEERIGKQIDALVLLQPTTPFRKYITIDKCVELYNRHEAESVVSVMQAPHFVNPHWVRRIEEGYLKPYLDQKDFTRRQDLPEVYWRTGEVYVVKKDVLFETNDLYGNRSLPFIMSEDYPVNIDNLIDFEFAEYLADKELIDFDFEYIMSEYIGRIN